MHGAIAERAQSFFIKEFLGVLCVFAVKKGVQAWVEICLGQRATNDFTPWLQQVVNAAGETAPRWRRRRW